VLNRPVIFGAGDHRPAEARRAEGKLTAGYYTYEPEFGNVVRAVMKLGYNGFAYEATSDPKTTPAPGHWKKRKTLSARLGEEGI
jgi:hypothetical protein